MTTRLYWTAAATPSGAGILVCSLIRPWWTTGPTCSPPTDRQALSRGSRACRAASSRARTPTPPSGPTARGRAAPGTPRRPRRDRAARCRRTDTLPGTCRGRRRVKADDVVLGRDPLGQPGRDESGERQATAAGAAGVDQQRALVLLGGVRDTGQREGDLLPARLPVVERHLERRALELGIVGGAALLPAGFRSAKGSCGVRCARLGGHGRKAPGQHDGGAAQHGCACSHGVLPRRRGIGPRGSRSSPIRPGKRLWKNVFCQDLTRLGREMRSNAPT